MVGSEETAFNCGLDQIHVPQTHMYHLASWTQQPFVWSLEPTSLMKKTEAQITYVIPLYHTANKLQGQGLTVRLQT